jgi:hypothetical protein
VQVPPAATHRFDEQHAPVSLQVLPAQHGLPVTPQGRQTPLLVSHTLLAPVHTLPEQHGSPAPPQCRHEYVPVELVYEQMLLTGSRQVPIVLPELVGQQAWPAFPQAHDPAEHVPYVDADVWQVWPSPTQRPARQQPLPAHDEPSQHGSPGSPHTVHTALWQMVPVPQDGVLVQQGSPGPPQPTQVPPDDAVVEHFVARSVQTLPQQLWPAAPQPLQCPAWQAPNVVPQAEPEAMQVPE